MVLGSIFVGGEFLGILERNMSSLEGFIGAWLFLGAFKLCCFLQCVPWWRVQERTFPIT